jgi:hypothetical protein
MKNITFDSKETYLAYRSAWKAAYKNLSAEIRLLRQADRYYQRKVFGHVALTVSEEACITAATKLAGTGSYQYQRNLRRMRATEMLVELKEAKLEAQRQYLARKAAESGATPAAPSA